MVGIYSMLQITPIDPFMQRSAPGMTVRVNAPRHTRYIPFIANTALVRLATMHMLLSIHTCRLYSIRAAARAAHLRMGALVNIRILASFIHAAFILPLYLTFIYSIRLPAISPARRLAALPTKSNLRASYRALTAPAHPNRTNPTHESHRASSENRPDSIPIPRGRTRTVRRAESPPFYNPCPLVKFYTCI